MACGCSKRKGVQNSAPTVQRVDRRISQNQATAERRTGRYRRVSYFVFQDGTDSQVDAEIYGTLAEAQKRLRDLGPGWSVEARYPD